MLIGGGIGITPLLSIWKRMVAEKNPKLKKVIFVWSLREVSIAEGLYNDQFKEIMEAANADVEANSRMFEDQDDIVAEGITMRKSLSKNQIVANRSVFEYQFHLTSVKNDVAFNKLQAKHPFLRSSIWRYGRPDNAKLFEGIEESSTRRVGVYVSGTFPLIAEERDLCDKTRVNCCGNAIRFDVHEEFFGF